MNDKRRSVRYRKVDRILGIYIQENLKASRWVAVKPSPISLRTRIKINIKQVVSCMIGIIYCDGPNGLNM